MKWKEKKLLNAPEIEKRKKEQITQETFQSRPPPVFRSRLEKKRVDALGELVRSQDSLMKSVKDHQRTLGELTDLETILEADRLKRDAELQEAQARLNDAKRQVVAGPQKDRISKLALDVEESELEQRLKCIKSPPKQDPAEERRAALENQRKLDQVEKENREIRLKEQIKRLKKREADLILKELEETITQRETHELKNIKDKIGKLEEQLYSEG